MEFMRPRSKLAVCRVMGQYGIGDGVRNGILLGESCAVRVGICVMYRRNWLLFTIVAVVVILALLLLLLLLLLLFSSRSRGRCQIYNPVSPISTNDGEVCRGKQDDAIEWRKVA